MNPGKENSRLSSHRLSRRSAMLDFDEIKEPQVVYEKRPERNGQIDDKQMVKTDFVDDYIDQVFHQEACTPISHGNKIRSKSGSDRKTTTNDF